MNRLTRTWSPVIQLFKVANQNCGKCNFINPFTYPSLKRALSVRLGNRHASGYEERQPRSSDRKVTIIGCTDIGLAIAIFLLRLKISNNVCIIDENKAKIRANMLDLYHATYFLGDPNVVIGTDYKDTVDSKVIIYTSESDEASKSEIDSIKRSVDGIYNIVPKAIQFSPNAVLLMVNDPVDIMTYVAAKASNFTQNRVIGSGTQLDSARFRYFVANRLGICPTTCNGWIIGEHGKTSVPVWSTLSVNGILLRDQNPKIGQQDDPENWQEIHEKVNGARVEIDGKSDTSWGIAMSAVSIANEVLNNSNGLVAATVAAKGMHSINSNVYLSLPCFLNGGGISGIIKQNLSDEEINKLQYSADILEDLQNSLKI